MSRRAVNFIPAIAVFVVVAAGLALALFRPDRIDDDQQYDIMNTVATLNPVTTRAKPEALHNGLRNAVAALRKVEAHMSSHLDRSEIANLNSAPAGEFVLLSADVRAVMVMARHIAEASDGAFDATVGPVIGLWVAAGKAKQLPTDEQIATAAAVCGWDKFELRDDGAVKSIDGARVNLGGIAKGYGIDKAIEALRKAGCVGGMVDVGGDVRVFGQRRLDGPWVVGVRNPFGPGLIGTVTLQDGSVCTSGNYERNFTIAGRRYSHIIDPRTSRPTDTNPSVTVIAPTAMVADAWATALSVLGWPGHTLLPAGVEAMVVTSSPQAYEIHMTEGFGERFRFNPPFGPTENAP